MKHVMAAVLLLSVAGILWACKKNESGGVFVVTHCGSALECSAIKLEPLDVCGWPDGPIDVKEKTGSIVDASNYYWSAYNFDPARDVTIAVRKTVEPSNGQQVVSLWSYLVRAAPKSMTKGGPTGDDTAGPPRAIGCQYKRIAEPSGGYSVTKFTYEIVSACYADEGCPDMPPEVTPASRPPTEAIASCEARCTSPDGQCDSYTLSQTDPDERKLGRELIALSKAARTGALPMSLPVAPILSALSVPGSAKVCYRGPFDVATDGEFTSLGDDCSTQLAISDGKRLGLERVVLSVPSIMRGKLLHSANPGSSDAAFVFIRDPKLMLQMREVGATDTISEPVAALSFSQTAMLLSGDVRYCGRIDFHALE